MIRLHIHTTISKSCRDWLLKESSSTQEPYGVIIEQAIEFYKENKVVIKEYEQARVFLKQIIKDELLADYEKSKPFTKRLINEAIKEVKEIPKT